MYTGGMHNETGLEHSRSIGIGIILIGILILTTFIPAKWFGIKPKAHVKLDLTALDTFSQIGRLSLDKNKNNNPDWRDLAIENFSLEKSSSTSSIIDPSIALRLNDPNNITASLSKNLYIASAYLGENGEVDAETKQEILDGLLLEEASKLATTTYAYKDLFVAAKETKETIKAYGNNVAEIIGDVLTEKTITDDIKSVGLFASTQKPSALVSLLTNKKRVDALLFKLLNISVPASSVSYHLLALNRVADYKNTLDNLSRADTDSIRATLALKQYHDVVLLVLRLNSQFSNYFNSKNIVFTSKESGYVFTSGYTTSK